MPDAEGRTPEIDLDQLAAAGDKVVVLDVRQESEYVQGHVPGALLIPMGELPGRMAELDKRAPVYVICASGARSEVMTDVLRSAGYDAHTVVGGTHAWVQSGRPVVTGPSARG